MADVRITKTTFSSEGVVELPPDPVTGEQHTLNLFTANKSAWRFETDDGRFAIVPVDNELLDDGPFTDLEAEARRNAATLLERTARVG